MAWYHCLSCRVGNGLEDGDNKALPGIAGTAVEQLRDGVTVHDLVLWRCVRGQSNGGLMHDLVAMLEQRMKETQIISPDAA
jgi:hypothetical protein